MASSSIVIKVKFGETLRRFTALIHEKKLTLDIVILRSKIRSLFNFDSDVDFTLTYIDEDGDVVTLADDDDLHDVVRQSLNPLRITVNLNTNKFDGSSGNSTPLRSHQDQLPGVSMIMKSVPEPLHDAISKLSHDLASKATSSSPVLAEIVEKMKMVLGDQLSEPMSGPRAHGAARGASDVNGQPGSDSVDPGVGNLNSKNKEKVQKVTEGLTSMDLNIPYFEYENFQAPVDTAEKDKEAIDGVENVSGSEKKKDSGAVLWKSVGFGGSNQDYLRQLLQDSKKNEEGGSSSAAFPKAANDSGNFSGDFPGDSSGWVQGMLNATNQCPFGGMPLSSDSHHYPSRSSHCKRGYNNGMGSIFHRGVRCDGCGVHPITGPRFKSKVKEDYDLCSVCMGRMGNVADYNRMERPMHHRHSIPFKGFHDHSLRIPPPLLPHALRAPGSKLPRSKLDSRFILDVNVLDGTIMAPFTNFTKIWRMRNNGTIIWPRGSQLQWIGGDRLSNSVSVEIEIPADGLPVDKELDIAVDFTAPELPGRYVSYWRMASPSGQKFGQRVWVLIQVDASMKDLGENTINLNLPPVVKNPEVVNQDPLMDSNLPENNFIKVTEPEDPFPINDTLIIDNGGSSSTKITLNPPFNPPVGPSVSSVFFPPVGPSLSSVFYPTVELDDSFAEEVVYPPTMDFPQVPSAVDSTNTAPSPPVPVVQPSVGSTSAAQVPPVPVVQPSSAAQVPLLQVVQPPGAATEEVSGDREQALLRELVEMGFNQVDLNKEILRMNKYDLEKSVDDLCGVSEWDPMLEELQEMGFSDNEANRRLLVKNNGSIKRVVMDLINGEKA